MSETYTQAEIVSWLESNLPRWQYQDGHLSRVYVTGNWQLTLMLANAIAFLAEAAWHHPDLLLSYPRLTVRLQTHDAGGITAKDFELARRIEEVATWLPAEGQALPGTPNRWIK
jgi:4a-hydroxytetrahydrobiopterin dehydratase